MPKRLPIHLLDPEGQPTGYVPQVDGDKMVLGPLDLGATSLDELADVDTTGKADGDFLAYDLSSDQWVPVPAPVGGGGGGGGGGVAGSNVTPDILLSHHEHGLASPATVTLPSSGFAAGDILVAFVAVQYQFATPSLPSDWVLIGVDNDGSGVSPTLSIACYVKRATSGDLGHVVSFSDTALSYYSVHVIAVDGASVVRYVSGGVNAVTSSGSADTIVASAGIGDLILEYGAVRYNPAGGFVAQASLTPAGTALEVDDYTTGKIHSRSAWSVGGAGPNPVTTTVVGTAAAYGTVVAGVAIAGYPYVPASGVTVQDENVDVATGVTQLDFQGAGVTVTPGTGEVVVTIPGGGGSLTVQDEGVDVATTVTQLDFQGAGVTVTPGTGEVVVTIPGGSGTPGYALVPMVTTVGAGDPEIVFTDDGEVMMQEVPL